MKYIFLVKILRRILSKHTIEKLLIIIHKTIHNQHVFVNVKIIIHKIHTQLCHYNAIFFQRLLYEFAGYFQSYNIKYEIFVHFIIFVIA